MNCRLFFLDAILAAMELTNTFHAPDRKTWRAWLEQNHNDAKEIWLIYFKAHTGQPSMLAFYSNVPFATK